MKRTGRNLLMFILTVSLFSACSKEEKQRYSGIDTIDNQLFGQSVYYAIGFSFDIGEPVQTDKQPYPDITVHATLGNDGLVNGAYLDTPILIPPFFLAGQFASSVEAETFYDNLLAVNLPVWLSTADPVLENQVWIVRTLKGNFAKFRVIDLRLENRDEGPFVEMKFEWRVQPDGTASFPE